MIKGPFYATKEDVLVAVCRYDVWPEELLGEMFQFTVTRVLAPLERQILELRVQGHDDIDVSRLLQVKDKQIRHIQKRMLRKLRLGAGFRVDDHWKLRHLMKKEADKKRK